MKILITRHGETIDNKNGILQGWLDSHLSPEGVEQARLLGKRLKHIKLNYIYSSDLKRCIDTAQEIAKYHPNAKFIKDKLIRERCLGEFQGKAKGMCDWDSLPGDILTNKPKGGETFEEVWARVSKFYKKIMRKHKEHTLLIVGHGGSMRLFEGIITQQSLASTLSLDGLKNTAVSEYEIDKKGNATLVYRNCQKHISD